MARYFLAFSEKEYHLSFQGILKKFNFSFLPLWFWLVQVRLISFASGIECAKFAANGPLLAEVAAFSVPSAQM